MKKISILFTIMLLLATASYAKSVVFTLTNGTKVYYLLGGETNPMMTFKDGKVVVNADEYQLTGIKNFYISDTDDPTGIEQVLEKKEVAYKNNQFVVNAEAKAVRVFSIKGAQVSAAITSAEGYTMIDLSELPADTYIINIDGESFKVMKK